MAGQIPPPRSFSSWIKALLALKAHWAFSDFALSWLRGARMLLDHGVTTVADIEAVPELLPDVRLATPLRVCSLFEMTGIRSRRPPRQILQEALANIDCLPPEAAWAGLSPHAPYSTTPELLRLSATAARQRSLPISTHVAESIEEFDMFTRATGPMYTWLKSQRDTADCGLGSPVQYLARQHLLGPNLLAVHVNYLADGDAALLSRTETSVVHCPRSHAYFGHQPFPLEPLRRAGVNICLGTDSLATTRTNRRQPVQLDLFAEMQAMAESYPGVSPERLLGFATLNGARALGKARQLGELSKGAFADLILIPYQAASDPYEPLVHHSGPVLRVMINGQWTGK
jgi:cytosine/adenosine deaminase-related metal-dependent hydrolase